MAVELNNIEAEFVKPMPTKAELIIRREKLTEILQEVWDKRQNPKDNELIEAMRAAGYREYARIHLYRDKLAVQAEDHFVSELSIFSYSAMMRNIFDKIEYVENESQKDFDDSKGFVRINSKKIYLECQKLKADILEGKVMDISVELLGKKLRTMQEENRKLKQLESKSPPVK